MWPFKKKPDQNKPDAAHQGKPETALTPPVDLNTPVENPELKSAIARLSEAQSADRQETLWTQLNRANFLVVFNPDEMKFTPSATRGQVHIEGGSNLKVLTCRAPDGKRLLPAFTDWSEVDAFGGERKVATLVMPSQQLWELVLGGSFEGAVINPAGMPLPLTREQLQNLKDGA